MKRLDWLWVGIGVLLCYNIGITSYHFFQAQKWRNVIGSWEKARDEREILLQQKQEAEKAKALLPPYSVVERSETPPQKASYKIVLKINENSLPDKKALAKISQIVKSQAGTAYKKVYTFFYVPGMDVDGVAYATVHYDPELTVEVMDYALPANFRAKLWGGTVGEHRQFDSIQAMMEDWGDFSSQDGSFKVLGSQSVSHIQISPRLLYSLLQETSQLEIEFDIHSTVIDTFYRAFIHTTVNDLKITALPMAVGGVIEPNKQSQYLPKFQETFFMTKQTALTIAQRYFSIQNLEDLRTTEHYEDGTVLEDWIPEFSDLLTDMDNPSLKTLIQEIRVAP